MGDGAGDGDEKKREIREAEEEVKKDGAGNVEGGEGNFTGAVLHKCQLSE